MARRLVNLLTALSLLLCVAVVVLWVRSYWVESEWSSTSHPGGPVLGFKGVSQRQRWAISNRGRLILAETDTPVVTDHPRDATLARGYRVLGLYSDASQYGVKLEREFSWALPGVEYSTRAAQMIAAGRISEPTPPHGWTGGLKFTGPTFFVGFRFLGVSWWLPALLFAVPPVLWGWRARVHNRKNRCSREQTCPRCGYDLRATPGRCPECGTMAPSVSA